MKRRLFRRLPLLLAVSLIGWTLLGDRPKEITLVYDLPTDPPPTAVEIRIVAEDGTTPSSLRWGSGQGPAKNRQSQKTRLQTGTYPLEIGREDERIVLYLR